MASLYSQWVKYLSKAQFVSKANAFHQNNGYSVEGKKRKTRFGYTNASSDEVMRHDALGQRVRKDSALSSGT